MIDGQGWAATQGEAGGIGGEIGQGRQQWMDRRKVALLLPVRCEVAVAVVLAAVVPPATCGSGQWMEGGTNGHLLAVVCGLGVAVKLAVAVATCSNPMALSAGQTWPYPVSVQVVQVAPFRANTQGLTDSPSAPLLANSPSTPSCTCLEACSSMRKRSPLSMACKAMFLFLALNLPASQLALKTSLAPGLS